MNLIERAGRQLGLDTAKSTADKLAERRADPRAANHAATPEAQIIAGPAVPAKPRRETRRRVTIDFERLQQKGFALPGDETNVAEEFRLIKRPLLAAARSNAPDGAARNVIMVTSAAPHEGKTFVAVNLAFSIVAGHDVSVLLIDGDFGRPSIPSVLGFEAESGLIDVLSDPTIELSDTLVRTNIENLTVLPAGPARPGSSELLASNRMARFVYEIAKRYADRIIIFDSPPVLARSEPIVLAKHAGQIVFVVEAERTSRAAAEEALGHLDAERIAGVVLNRAPAIATHDRFGRYYYDYAR